MQMIPEILSVLLRLEDKFEALIDALNCGDKVREQAKRLSKARAELEKTVDQFSSPKKEMGTMAGTPIDDLTTQVTSTVGVEASAATLIKGLAAALAAAGTDPVKLKALQDQLNASATDLAAAVAANPTP